MVENLSRRCGGFLKSLSLRGCQLVSDNALRLTISLVFMTLKKCIIRSTSESRPNSIEGKNVRPYVRPSTKSFFNLNEIRYIGRGR